MIMNWRRAGVRQSVPSATLVIRASAAFGPSGDDRLSPA